MGKSERNNDGVGQDKPEPEVDTRCGYRSCKPSGLQIFNKPSVLLFFVCIQVLFQGFVVNGVNNVNVSSYERRFHLSSSRSSTIASAYDFSAAIFGFFLSFLGSGRYKARWLAAGGVALGLGSFTMAVPHFTTGLYVYEGDAGSRGCQNASAQTEHCESEGIKNYLYVLILGMVLHGVGGAILFTIGIGLLDDSVNAQRSPTYLGIFYGAATLGPGIGFVVGGQFLNSYVDFDKVDQDSVGLSKSDPRWVGAWWLAFCITMVTFILTAIPLSCFGAELPAAQKVRETRTSQMHKGETDNVHSNSRLSIRQVPRAVIDLFKNPVFTCITFAGACESVIMTGFSTFVSKYVQNHFNISSGSASIYTGIVTIPGAAGGMLVGGLICSKMKLKVAGMLKLILITTFLSAVFSNLYWLKCDDVNLAGVARPYKDESSISVDSTCNEGCGCSTRFYDAMCYEDSVQYFSACHAGCTNVTSDGETFTNCSCLPPDPASNFTMVTEGRCTMGCDKLYIFLVLFFFSLFFFFMPTVATDSAILRSIHDDHRTFSMGLERTIGRLLGTVPGPVIFGALTDVACKVWEVECEEESSCWVYDNFQVSRNYFIVSIGLKVLSFALFSLALCLYKPPKYSPDTDHRIKTIGGCDNKTFQNGATNEEFPPNYVMHRESSTHF